VRSWRHDPTKLRDALAADAVATDLSGVGPELALSLWTPVDYQTAAEPGPCLLCGHADAQINDQYRSLHGSLRFLHNIVRFPGCGVFEPGFSWMLRERRSGVLAGMVLCSRVGEKVAHITQLCVAQHIAAAGLAALLERSARSLLGAGFEAIHAYRDRRQSTGVRLYKRFGFTLRHRFDAMVLEPQFKRAMSSVRDCRLLQYRSQIRRQSAQAPAVSSRNIVGRAVDRQERLVKLVATGDQARSRQWRAGWS